MLLNTFKGVLRHIEKRRQQKKMKFLRKVGSVWLGINRVVVRLFMFLMMYLTILFERMDSRLEKVMKKVKGE